MHGLPLFLAAAAAPAPAYPAVEVLEAFGQACAGLDKIEATGWQRYDPPADSPLGALIAYGKEEGAKLAAETKGKLLDMGVYRKTVAGETLDLVRSGAEVGGVRVDGCRVYDVGETRQIPVAVAQKWIGREPTRQSSLPAISIAVWEPGQAPGQDSFELFFVPEGSPAIAMLKFSGVAMKADYIGEAH